MREVLSYEEMSVCYVRGILSLGTYCDNSIILHKPLLRASEKAQERQHQRRRSESNWYESGEPHDDRLPCDILDCSSRK